MKENKVHGLICRYDSSSDTLGVKVNHKFQYNVTVEMDEGLLLDFDVDNVPVSFEVLDASKRFGLPRESLNNIIFFKMEVCVEEKSISINAIIGVLIDNIEDMQNIRSFTSNINNFPNGITELALV